MKTLLNKQLNFPFQTPPEPGELIEVAKDVFWLRMPLPFSLAHINLWLLKDNEGWVIIDTGIKSDETKQLWDEIFTRHLQGLPVTKVVLTHLHPDHMGLAQWLTQRWQVELWMTQTEWLYAQLNGLMAQSNLGDNLETHFSSLGLAKEVAGNMKKMLAMFSGMSDPTPSQYRRISAGDEIIINGRSWRVMIGQGHSPEHACYYCDELNIIIGGDQLLPRITPSISVSPEEPEGNPLGLFLESNKQFYDLPEDCLVLPSHELPYTGVHKRLDQFKVHHEERFDLIIAACSKPLSGVELMAILFSHRKLSPIDEIMALGETIAHVNYLLQDKRLTRSMNKAGLYQFSTTEITEKNTDKREMA